MATDGTPAEPAERSGWSTHQLLSLAARSVERHWDHTLSRLGLSHAGVLALKGLADAGPVTQETLAALVRVQGQSLGGVLARLETTGYISRRRDEADRRGYQVRITSAGQDILRAAQESEHGLLPARFRAGPLHRELIALLHAGRTA